MVIVAINFSEAISCYVSALNANTGSTYSASGTACAAADVLACYVKKKIF